MSSKFDKVMNEIKRAQKLQAVARYYQLNSILGNTWAMFYIIVGGRKTGKSYSVTDFLCRQKMKHGDQCKNYWMRISETSTKAMLSNKADKLVDPDLKRKYKLNLTTRGMMVYNNSEEFMTVAPLSQFGKLKGVGFYDKDYTGWYNIVLDEFQLEQGEKRTSFDILYNFIGMCENLVRTTKSKVRVFLLGNTLEEASTILRAFNFLPEKFGRFYLKSKRAVVDNIEPTEEYLADRRGSIADILGGDDMSNYTNEIQKDRELLFKGQLYKPSYIIKFSKSTADWYTVWDSRVITRWNHEKLPMSQCIAMRPYLDNYFDKLKRQNVIDIYDVRGYKFKNLIVQSYFTGSMQMLRKDR